MKGLAKKAGRDFEKRENVMIRKIIKINEEKCNGCGLCADACHEGAILVENGKAKLLRDDYCDGLGDCLPACPTGAVSIEEREAAPYDEAAVAARAAKKQEELSRTRACPGSAARAIKQKAGLFPRKKCMVEDSMPSRLNQWPVQIRLAPERAPFFEGADLLVAADCTAYAHGNFHNEFMRDRITLIGCPKLDDGDYAEKLAAIIKNNGVKSVTVVRMEVPCCGGIERAVKTALARGGKTIQARVITIATDGGILEE